MPRKRLPLELWRAKRVVIWERDGGKCFHCGKEVALEVCHIDHIQSGKLGTNDDSNLRVLCKRCHVLRLDNRHRGMIGRALEEGLIDENWRNEGRNEVW